MRLSHFFIALLISLIILVGLRPVQNAQALGNGFGDQPDTVRLIVGVQTSARSTLTSKLSAVASAKLVDTGPQQRWIVVEVPRQQLEEALQTLRQDPGVRYVEPDTRVSITFDPDDPYYNDPNLVYGPQQINAPAAWDITTGSSQVTIAILDTGIDLSHPEFAGRVLAGWDFVNQDSDPSDDHGHGTHVAGIAAAAINNGTGIAGIAGNASIMPVKVLDQNGSGWWSEVAAGIIWAADHGADVINMSLSGPADSQTARDAIAYANSLGTVVVVAAGNDGTDSPRYPAAFENVIAVGATTYQGARWTLSNFGPNVDVMAPGATIYSTYGKLGQPSGYQFMTGTSMAAPHVAGLVALMRSANPSLSPTEIRDAIQNTAVDLGDPGYDAFYGYGLVDAYAALSAVAASGPTPTPT
ncbi:MAG: peptidase S8, partial [Caldilineae bacterium]